MEDPDRRVAQAIFISKPDVTACGVNREISCKTRQSGTVALLEPRVACPESGAATEGKSHQGDSRKVDPRVRCQQIPGAINVRPLPEKERDLRQAELGKRAHLLHAGHAGEFGFQRERDELFDFFGSERGNFGVDLHLNAGDVRHGVNRQSRG